MIQFENRIINCRHKCLPSEYNFALKQMSDNGWGITTCILSSRLHAINSMFYIPTHFVRMAQFFSRQVNVITSGISRV